MSFDSGFFDGGVCVRVCALVHTHVHVGLRNKDSVKVLGLCLQQRAVLLCRVDSHRAPLSGL